MWFKDSCVFGNIQKRKNRYYQYACAIQNGKTVYLRLLVAYELGLLTLLKREKNIKRLDLLPHKILI